MSVPAERTRPPAAAWDEPPPDSIRVIRHVEQRSRVVVATHPGVLPVAAYGPLAEALSDDVELGVLELEAVPEYRGAALRGESLQMALTDIATRFAARVLEYADGQPYLLLGWSFGGVIGYAVAELLSARTPPAALLLLDSIAPGPGDPGQCFGDAIPDQVALFWFSMYFGATRGVRLDFAGSDFAARAADEGLRAILERCLALSALPQGTSLSAVRKVFQAFLSGMLRNKQLQDGYAPEPPRWPVVLLRPQGSLLEDAPSLGWSELVGPSLELHRCRADHYTLLADADAVRRIAQLISTHLAPLAGTS